MGDLSSPQDSGSLFAGEKQTDSDTTRDLQQIRISLIYNQLGAIWEFHRQQ